MIVRSGVSFFLVFLLPLILICPGLLYATSIAKLNLNQMHSIAYQVFLGQVDSVEPGYDEDGRDCSYIGFSVTEAYKGEPSDRVRIKQLPANNRFLPVPSFGVGEEVLVFLAKPSSIGFSTTLGLGLGVFRIYRDEFGHEKLVNDFGNYGLLDGMRHQAVHQSMGLSERLFSQTQREPQGLYLEQMRTLLKGINNTNISGKP
jgi:hypothetical protein